MRLRRTGRRVWGVVVVCVAVFAVLVVGASFFVPVGPRAGMILGGSEVRDAWQVGLTRGVLCYRRETPPILGGQQIAWEPTLTGPDPFGPWHRDVSWWRIMWNVRGRPVLVSEARVPVWPAAVAMLGWAVWVVRGWVVVGRRRRRRECVRCGYPRAGGACAECGWVEGG